MSQTITKRPIPELPVHLPRPIRSLHQIELTSRCNLACRYCPHHKMTRPKIDMSIETYERALYWAKRYVDAGTQEEINLAGTGESTLHPQFVEMVHMARAAVGSDVKITIATNGLICNEEMVSELAKSKPEVWVSLHRPEKAARAVKLYHDYGLLVDARIDPVTRPNSWAGQVDWLVDDTEAYPCQWMRRGFVMARVDGAIMSCCLDNRDSDDGVLGTVCDDLTELRTAPYSLCRSCHQVIGVIGHDQRTGK